METFWRNNYMETAGKYSVVILSIVVFLTIFELVTKYKNWEEIKNGNIAVAMATGGKIIGMSIIFRSSIVHHDSIPRMMAWGIVGFVLLLIGYFIFEFLTPKFNVDDEISSDNRAVGLISLIISIGLSFVVGASIS